MNNSNQLNMFRTLISPILRSTWLCVTACSIMHRRCCRPVTGYRPKHVELIGIINKPSLLHLVGCLYYYISDARSSKCQIYWLVFSNLFNNLNRQNSRRM